MYKLNCKGVSLVEMLIVVALLGVISPILFTFFISGISDFQSCSNLLDQEYRAQDVIRQIRQDLEQSESVTFDYNAVGVVSGFEKEANSVKFTLTTGAEKEWKYDGTNNTLSLSTDGGVTFNAIVENIDVSRSRFIDYENGSIRKLILKVKPIETGSLNKARNVKNEIITEFSLRYKFVY